MNRSCKCGLYVLAAALCIPRVNAQEPELVVQTGQFLIRRAAFSADSSLLATASQDGTVKIWDGRFGHELRTLSLGNASIEFVSFVRGGRAVVTVSTTTEPTSGNRHVTIWNVTSGARELEFEAPIDRIVAFHPVEDVMVYQRRTGAERDLAIHDFRRSSDQDQVIAESPSAIKAIRFSPDGTRLAATFDGLNYRISATLRIWETTHWTRLHSIVLETDPMEGQIVFRPNGQELAVAETPGGRLPLRFSLWDILTGQRTTLFPSSFVSVYSLGWTGDNRILSIGCGNKSVTGFVQGWDLASREETGGPSFLNCYVGKGVELSPDGTMLTYGKTSITGVRSAVDGQPLYTLQGKLSPVTSLGFVPDRQTLISATFRGELKLWSLKTGRYASSLRLTDEKDGRRYTTIAVSPNGKMLAAGDARGDGLTLWDLGVGKQVSRLLPARYSLWTLTFSADSHLLAAGIVLGGRERSDQTPPSNETEVILFDVTNPVEIKEMKRFSGFASADFDPNGHTVTLSRIDLPPLLWDAEKKSALTEIRGLLGLTIFNPAGHGFATRGSGNEIRITNSSGDELARLHPDYWPRSFVFDPHGNRLVTFGVDKDRISRITVWNVNDGTQLRELKGHKGPILSVAFMPPDGRFLASASLDRTIKLWDMTSSAAQELATLVSFDEAGWAVIAPNGLFDGSTTEGVKRNVHWVVGNEAITFHQIKRAYYDPRLLAKMLGYNVEPMRRARPFMFSQRHFPDIQTRWLSTKPERTLEIKVRSRGGGIGPVQVFLNGAEFVTDARPVDAETDTPELTFSLSIPQSRTLSGTQNSIRIVASNTDSTFSSRGSEVNWLEPARPVEPIQVYAIVAGVSEYASPRLKLSFSSKDAEAIAYAIRLAARYLTYGEQGVHIKLLADSKVGGAIPPTKQNFEQAFKDFEVARPQDILIVYLSGHGVAVRGSDAYLYLTQEATEDTITADDAGATISSDELAALITKVPALKRVMILDTCGAGAARAKLAEIRDVEGDAIRALDTFSDRTGFHVLLGAAADKESYEASPYGQGLLTYSLLQGMKGPAVEEDKSVRVFTLFKYAEETVPGLAKGIGGIQKPEFFSVAGQDFALGLLYPADREKIPLLKSPKPIVLKPTLLQSPGAQDTLKLSEQLAEDLRDISDVYKYDSTDIVYFPHDDFPGGIRVTGLYEIDQNAIKMRLVLAKGPTPCDAPGSACKKLDLDGSTQDLRGFSKEVVSRISIEAVRLQ